MFKQSLLWLCFIQHRFCVLSDPAFWNRVAKEELDKAVKHNAPIVGVAKNVILFLGDGMGMPTVTAGRILAGQMAGKNGEEHQLSFDKFPNVALSKVSGLRLIVSVRIRVRR